MVRTWALVGALVVAAVACGASEPDKSDSPPDPEETCEPGVSGACTCNSGLEGSRACLPTGDGFSTCSCAVDTTTSSTGGDGGGAASGGGGAMPGEGGAGGTPDPEPGPCLGVYVNTSGGSLEFFANNSCIMSFGGNQAACTYTVTNDTVCITAFNNTVCGTFASDCSTVLFSGDLYQHQ